MIEIVGAIISGITAIAVAVLGMRQTAEAKKNEHQSMLRRREAILSLKMSDANMQLSIVTSNALTNGHNNGNVERARIAAEEAAEEYKKFMQELTAETIVD